LNKRDEMENKNTEDLLNNIILEIVNLVDLTLPEFTIIGNLLF